VPWVVRAQRVGYHAEMDARRAVRMFRQLVLCALLSSLALGCTSAGERIVPWYITRKLDSYLDLTSPQKDFARATVDEALQVARTSELPHWINLLREVRQGIHQGLDESSIARLQGRYDARLDVSVQLLAPRLSAILTQLDDRQIDHFCARMREDLRDQYKELDKPPAERAKEIEKRGLKAIEDLVGDLSETQEQTLRGLIRSFPNERGKQNLSAEQHIARFASFMHTHPSAAQIEVELRTMWEHRYDALGPGHDKTARRAQQRQWLLGVSQMLTGEQRAHAEDVITDRIVMLKRFVIVETRAASAHEASAREQ
jgi:hypothetical protein